MAAVVGIVADSGRLPMRSGQVGVGVVLISAAYLLERSCMVSCMYLVKGITSCSVVQMLGKQGSAPHQYERVAAESESVLIHHPV